MSVEALTVSFCLLAVIICLSCTLISVKLYTEWVKYGILKDKK